MPRVAPLFSLLAVPMVALVGCQPADTDALTHTQDGQLAQDAGLGQDADLAQDLAPNLDRVDLGAGLSSGPEGAPTVHTSEGVRPGEVRTLECASMWNWVSDADTGMMTADRFTLQLRPSGLAHVTHVRGWEHAEVAAELGLPTEAVDHGRARWSGRTGNTTVYLGDGHSLMLWELEPGQIEGYASIMPELPADAPPCGGMSLSCWDPTVAPSFRYDPDTGACHDAEGAVGLNRGSAPRVRDTGDGQCMDLSWHRLSEGATAGFPLDGWDLRGAVLDSAMMVDGELTGALMEGADLTGLTLTNAALEGSTDAHTILLDGVCTTGEDGWAVCGG